jgi:hypothetical protein
MALLTLAGVIAVGGLAAGCGSDDKAVVQSTSDATSGSSSTSAPPSTGTTTSGASGWQQTAAANRGQNGQTFTVSCPPGGTEGTVWGASTYTDDSSICTAAVQSGLITFAKGGTVTYKIAPGLDSYEAGTGNGVTSQSYGSWPGSFTLPDAAPGAVTPTVGTDSWTQTATAFRGRNGTLITVKCSPNGTLGAVWGSEPYTDDSSICTAAVHNGLITLAEGGTVVITIAPGADAYQGTTANGVTTSDYGSYAGSFTLNG